MDLNLSENELEVLEKAYDSGRTGRVLLKVATGLTSYKCRQYIKWRKETADNKTLSGDNLKLQIAKQKLLDQNRINRKQVRNTGRIVNAVEEYSKSILEALSRIDISDLTTQHGSSEKNDCGACLHISDQHFNELVNLNHNKYDFKVASKRLKKLARQSVTYMKSAGVKTVVIANSGDSMNSDRRLDEYLSMSTNRGNATILSLMLMEQFLIDINQQGFNVEYACVTGNESRVKEEPGWTDIVATDNYDFTIFNMLKWHFRDNHGIKFIDGDPTELVFNIAGHNILLLHGHTKPLNRKGELERGIQSIVGKYARRGQLINYVIFGHIHSSYISDWFSRAGSLVGDNEYSDKGLQLSGRASQNLILFYKNGSRDSINIDLQSIDGITGYNIVEDLESYNAKSSNKNKKKTAIYQVVI